VFRCIAAEWKSVEPESVNDALRQQAKQVQLGRREDDGGVGVVACKHSPPRLCLVQICYGIIYGMGAKSLGEQMGVEEDDAACYIESFKSRYKGRRRALDILRHRSRECTGRLHLRLPSCVSGINAFLRETVKKCVKTGYVQTLMGRRRYLPAIANGNAHAKAHVSAHAHRTPCDCCISFPPPFIPVTSRRPPPPPPSGRAPGGEHNRTGLGGGHC